MTGTTDRTPVTDPGGTASALSGAVTWHELLAVAAAELGRGGFENAAQEACWLVERAGGFESGELPLALGRQAPLRGAMFFRQMLDRRLTGEPLQYVLGQWSFRSLELYVDRRVLIPRPETEVLVERALAECDRLDATTAADLGTGSGAVGLSLAWERPRLATVWATDASEGALAVARANLAGLGRRAGRVQLALGSWFEALPGELRGRLDVVVSNPPYVADGEVADLPEEVRRWEPAKALVSGPEGMDAITTILEEAPGWLARPGSLLLEMAPHQVEEARRLAEAAGFPSVTIWPDLAGRDRILVARR